MTQSDRPDEPTIEVLANQLYDELHDLAGAKLRGERRDHTLSPTALAVIGTAMNTVMTQDMIRAMSRPE